MISGISKADNVVRLHWSQSLLPGIHLALCAVTAFTSANTPGGTWYRLIPIDPVCWPFLWVVTSNKGVFALFGILGTAQWYLIGLFIYAVIKRLY